MGRASSGPLLAFLEMAQVLVPDDGTIVEIARCGAVTLPLRCGDNKAHGAGDDEKRRIVPPGRG